MNKKTLLSFVLAVLSVNSSISYGMEAGVQIEPPPSRVNRKGMDRITYGKISQYLPMETRAKLAEVCKEADFGIDFTSGYIDKYMDLYRIISKTNRDENLARGRYEINTAEDFLEIYKIITKNKFKIFRVPTSLFCKKLLNSSIITTFYDSNYGHNYVIFPVSYNFNNKDYDLSEEEEDYIKNLKTIENKLEENECICENFPLERFFKINFDINENMYPKHWNNSVKQEFNKALSTFLKRQFAFDSKYSYRSYNVPDNILKFEDMRMLKNMMDHDTGRYHSNPFENETNIVYQTGIHRVLENLWNEGQISQEFNYITNIRQITAQRDGLEYHPIYKVFCSFLTDLTDFYYFTGLPHEIFIRDFETVLNNLDAIKISMRKCILRSSFFCCSVPVSSFLDKNHNYLDNFDRKFNCFFDNGNINFDAILNLFYVLKFAEVDSCRSLFNKTLMVDFSKYFLNKIRDNVKDLSENEIIEKYGENYLKTMEILRRILPEEF